jgi:DNA-binding CsgD family transcriptional regulator
MDRSASLSTTDLLVSDRPGRLSQRKITSRPTNGYSFNTIARIEDRPYCDGFVEHGGKEPVVLPTVCIMVNEGFHRASDHGEPIQGANLIRVQILGGSPLTINEPVQVAVAESVEIYGAAGILDGASLKITDGYLVAPEVVDRYETMRRLAEAAEATGAGAVVLIVSRRLNELAHEYMRTAAQGPIPAEVGGCRQPTPRQRLSEREEQVLRQISRGLTHRQVAIHLGISRHTVDTYVKRIRSKLGVGNKAELTRAAMLDDIDR